MYLRLARGPFGRIRIESFTNGDEALELEVGGPLQKLGRIDGIGHNFASVDELDELL